jgi:hypothetical protein
MTLDTKDFDSYKFNGAPPPFSSELTRVLPLWNHPDTVALHLACGPRFLNYAVEGSNFCGCASVKQG